MSEAPSCAELDGSTWSCCRPVPSCRCSAPPAAVVAATVARPLPAVSARAAFNQININLFGEQTNYAGNGWRGQGGGSIGGAGGPAVS